MQRRITTHRSKGSLSASLVAAALQSHHAAGAGGGASARGGTRSSSLQQRQRDKWERERRQQAQSYALASGGMGPGPAASARAGERKEGPSGGGTSLEPLGAEERAVLDALGEKQSRGRRQVRAPMLELEEEYVLPPERDGLPAESLAQRLGLLPSQAAAPLSPSAWEDVRQRCMARGDMTRPCPICVEPLACQAHLLLSCSHLYHRACLESYERYSGRRACPMCRREGYEKRVVRFARDWWMCSRILRLQAWWRMVRARRAYQAHQQLHPPHHPLLLRRFKLQQVQEATRLLEREARELEAERAQLWQTMEREVGASRDILDRSIREFERLALGAQEDLPSQAATSLPSLDPQPGVGPCDWNDVYHQLLLRAPLECAICLCPLALHDPRRPTALLSCTHAFHATCLGQVEAFRAAGAAAVPEVTRRPDLPGPTVTPTCPTCPCCRSAYHKLEL